jgi:heptosyltransferase I
MSDILFIKTSSLGDVIHHMPALTEARRALPGTRFAWLVEEAYAPVVALHPGVAEIIPVAWRRWRKTLYSPKTISEISENLGTIRSRRYDGIVDSQGLLRSALIARLAHGRRHGYDSRNIREPAAALLYDVRHNVGRDLHAVERNRILTGRALGYAPQGAPDFGLDRVALARGGGRYALLLHATARPDKEWPETNWIALGNALACNGRDLILPWGSPQERARAGRISAKVAGATVASYQPLDELTRLIAGASFVVGVDTGLLHVAAALGVPLVAIFTGSRPGLTGPVGSGPMAVLGSQGYTPAVADVAAAVERIAP